MAPGQTGDETDARRVLSRPAREGAAKPGAASNDADWAEVWGVRIGRVLGPALLLAAAAAWAIFHLVAG